MVAQYATGYDNSKGSSSYSVHLDHCLYFYSRIVIFDKTHVFLLSFLFPVLDRYIKAVLVWIML